MHNVTIFTTSHCVWCKATKEFFKENNVKYKEINVEEDEKAAHEMVEKSGQLGVPVIDIDSQIIIGFDKPALKKALDIK
ncbi:glutaredoxin family protein [Candidatus Woesearchaeota archaeon]|nr:glutaredoxin family protein [Candidatus Woesearchaeota archaeon]